jgi:RNA recognition motif-containing protein
MEELQTVYVKGLPSIVTEEDIRDIFSSCGNILQLNWDADKR